MLKSKIKELKKITWTPPGELAENVGIVIVFSAFFVIIIFGLDTGISFTVKTIIRFITG